jgi:hypothetical protein
MAKRHYLRFLIRGQPKDLIVGVRENESDRLRHVLSSDDTNPASVRFFWFDLIDGRSMAINLAEMQAVRYLWDPSEHPPDDTRSEELIKLLFRGSTKPVEAYTDEPDQIFDFFANLQHGPEVVAYPVFNDEDGEPFQVNPVELVWISAPTHLLREGQRLIAEADDPDNDDALTP